MAKKKKKQTLGNSTSVQGLVIRSTGSHCTVRLPDGSKKESVVRGKFRIKGLRSTNPVAVGDWVKVSISPDHELGVITDIEKRKNYILRRAVAQTHKVHILAANVDQAIVVFTLAAPATSTGFIDRFLVSAEAYHIPAVIVFNKIDLLTHPEHLEILAATKEIYESIGYTCYETCAFDDSSKTLMEQLLKDKNSFIGGHSGSGKSTLINLVDPDLRLRTSEISDYTQKGRHTTTYAEMHPLPLGGYIIDSPGIKELGLVYIKAKELSHYFPEMRARMADCKFNDCQHLHEPGCAIKAALEAGEIAPSRYLSYQRMYEELLEQEEASYG